MISLQEKFGNLKPGYMQKYRDFIEQVAQFGGGAEDDKYTQAKSFSNTYELYIYAFFIGLYNDKRIDITDEDKLTSFLEMKNWKPEALTNSLLTCAIAVSDFDMNSIEEKDNDFISKQIRLVKSEIEAFANGGLEFIKSEIDQDPELLEDDMYFIKLLST